MKIFFCLGNLYLDEQAHGPVSSKGVSAEKAAKVNM